MAAARGGAEFSAYRLRDGLRPQSGITWFVLPFLKSEGFHHGLLGDQVLAEVEAATGCRFRYISSIDSRDKRIAESVLPVLCNIASTVKAPNIRDAIYGRFHTPHAYRFLDDLIAWWQCETYEMALGTLTQDLALLAKPADGLRLWTLCKRLPQRPFHFMLLGKLASFPSVENEVKDSLVRSLREDTSLTVGDLGNIAEVNDPRIRQWFAAQVDSKNRFLKALARRVVAKGKKLPKGVEVSLAPPDRARELFSTEVELGRGAESPGTGE